MTRRNAKPRSGNYAASMDRRPENAQPRANGGGNKRQLPANWRDRLPDPATYYAAHIAKLSRPNPSGWAQGKCPFHDDGTASLSVHVSDERGCWRCFAGCGSGDLVAFHVRMTGESFKDAVANLLRTSE